MTNRLPPESNRMAPDRAPTPFSAGEIANGCQPGRSSIYRIVEEGSPAFELRWEFTGGDDLHAEFATHPHDEQGAPLGAAATTRISWSELQAHASYPQEQTSITIETITVPAGTFECFKYRVTDGRILTEAWFPLDLPGPPALKVDTVDGVEVASMTLLEYRDPRR